MTRHRKTVLLLLAPAALYAACRGFIRSAETGPLAFFAILAGIISYGYLVMADEEFQGDTKGRMLVPFAFACAGCTAIAKVFVDALVSNFLPAASIAAAGLWVAVLVFVFVKTSLFKKTLF